MSYKTNTSVVNSLADARITAKISDNTVQQYSTHLAAIDGLDKSDGGFIVTNGTTYVIESGATARTSMGLGTAATSNTGDFATAGHNHDATYLALAGGTLTGSLILNADPTNDLGAATKQYVDATATGLDLKASVRVATTASSDLTGYSYVSGATDEWTGVTTNPSLDGVTMADGERILIKDATDSKGNGIWTYDSASNKFIRATDADNNPGTEVTNGMFCFVEEGTTNGGSGFVLTTAGSITLGTTALTFTQFSDSSAPVSSVFGRTGAVVALSGDYNAGQITFTATGDIVATDVQAAIAELDTEKLASSHEGSGGAVHADATTSVAGFMSAADKTKLDGVASGAEVNVTVFADDVFRIEDNTDATKELAFEVSAITTATTRTITMPDQNIDLTPGTGSFATAAQGTTADSALQNISEDTTPSLGGNLDVSGNSIVSTSNGDITLAPNGTGKVVIDGINWPTSDGVDGYFLKTNGTGTLSFAPATVSTVDDATFRIQDNSDNTKEIAFQASGITTGTTRTVTMPDQNIDLTPGTGSFATAAEGDLAATALQNLSGSVLSDLSNVTETSIADGEILVRSGSNWINNTLAEAGIAETANLATVATSGSYNDLSNQPTITPSDVYGVSVVTGSGSYTVQTTDHVVIINKTADETTTVNLPAGATAGTGQVFIIKDGKGDAATYNVTIDPNSTETIDGDNTVSLNQNYESVTICWNGTQWNLI